MEPFLKQVAEYLYKYCVNDFKNITLVLPNRRSGVFLLKYLSEVKQKTIWLPEILTINEFIENQSKLVLADNITLLAELYKTYCSVSKSKESFDEFYFWGDIMLNDFNDIDKYLIEPEAIFANVKELKNMESGMNYLTEDQIAVLKRFFSSFNPDKNSKLKENFLQIWNFLLPVYIQFNKSLYQKGFAYEGMLYKHAVQQIKNNAPLADSDNFFFIGFNAITRCEEEIFKMLKHRGLAQFFWDYDSYYIENKTMQAGYFLRNHLKNFPSPELFTGIVNNFVQPKKIKVIASPTNDSQAFKAGEFIHKLNLTDYSNTALVLADENLLVPALNYLPASISDVNITMGYPVKDTLTGSLIEMYTVLHSAKGTAKSGFYYKHVLPLLRHPYIAAIEPEASNLLSDKIQNEHLFNVGLGDVGDNLLFTLLLKGGTTAMEFSESLADLLWRVQEGLSVFVEQQVFHLDFEQLYNVYMAVKKLGNQLSVSNLNVSVPVYFKLLRKIIHGLRIPFEGEPVKGLQVMGFLETRNLDFENLYILSVNDSLLPSANVSPSFIPFGLRRGFGLPVRELHDAMYAYYFYRLIQRATNITLIYNTGTSGMATGEKSRFVQQLIYDNNFEIEELVENHTLDLAVKKAIEIEKTGLVKEKLESYFNSEMQLKISPSALVTYLTCPLKFYYQQILRIRDNDELTESVDARLFGNIFHESAEAIYQPFFQSGKQIEKADLLALSENESLLDSVITDAFKSTFWGSKSAKSFIVKGRNTIVFDIIKKYLIRMLHIDMEYAPLQILGLESKLYSTVSFEQNGVLKSVVLGGYIDRLDKTDGVLRIIDYKTGADQLGFSSVDEVFEAEKIGAHKAALQTLIYGYVCSKHYSNETAIVPGIYKVKDFFSSAFAYKIHEKSDGVFSSSNVLRIENEIEKGLQQILANLFDYSQPFNQTSDEKRCDYCLYKTMCGK